MSLASTNEESAWTEKKISVRRKQPPSGSDIVSVDSFRLLTTSVRVMWKVETRFLKDKSYSKKLLLF